MRDVETKDIVSLYNSGLSTVTIAEMLDISPRTVRNRLRSSNDVVIRKAGPQMRSANCIHCGSEFKTKAPNAVACKMCIPNTKWATKYCKWGITKPQFEKMLEKQSGLCDLCELPLPKNIEIIHVDHCHTQGHVRALLHSRCNRGLGFIEDDKFLANAVRYIERHKK